MYLGEHNSVLITLVATSSGRYDRHQAKAIQNLRRLYKMSSCVGPIYINVNIC